MLIEVQDALDEQALPGHPRAEVRWLHRGALPAGAALANALHQLLPLERGTPHAWIACESTAVRLIRRDLLSRNVFDPGALHTRGYWKFGAPNHPDHDMGQD